MCLLVSNASFITYYVVAEHFEEGKVIPRLYSEVCKAICFHFTWHEIYSFPWLIKALINSDVTINCVSTLLYIYMLSYIVTFIATYICGYQLTWVLVAK